MPQAHHSSFRIEAPTVQNWSCHGCTQCCRGRMRIDLTSEEVTRIQAQGWTTDIGVDPDGMLVKEGKGYRLGHQPDGACVFLDSATGKCRIHARFGEDQKPRACRLYPLALHPAGDKLMVGLRFSCPSAAANSGEPLSRQIPGLRSLAQLIVPENFSSYPPPPVLRKQTLHWPDFLKFTAALDQTLADEQCSTSIKLQRCLRWLSEVEKAGFSTISGREADEILSAVIKNASHEISSFSKKPGAPSAAGITLFRTLIFLYSRKDGVGNLKAGAGYRLKMFWKMLRFAKASGVVPLSCEGFKTAAFSDVEGPFGPLSSEAEALLTRFFRVKIQSLHFCGRAYYDLSLIEGFHHLALLYPVILWLAKWHAAGEKRSKLTQEDFILAIGLADHHHGYSPLLGMGWSRKRVRLLAQRNDIARLCAHLDPA